VMSAGDWILFAALHRKEASSLFSLGHRPNLHQESDCAWEINVVKSDGQHANYEPAYDVDAEELPESLLNKIKNGLSYQYPNIAATVTPSKQTATQLKGRQKDQEVADGTENLGFVKRNWRRPTFIEDVSSGQKYGTLLHLVMQHIRFESCGSIDGICKEIERLSSDGFISTAQVKMIDPAQLLNFFSTDLGKRIRTAKNVIREFKFSLLDNARRYNKDAVDEKVLLQGIIDCAMIEPDGITIVDFKTDRVTDEKLQSYVDGYAQQISVYSYAIEQIYEKPVKASLLYFFHLNKFVEVS